MVFYFAPRRGLRTIRLFLAVVLVLPFVVRATNLCPALSDVTRIDTGKMRDEGYAVDLNGNYFCASTAPAPLQCTCGSAAVCVEKLDPWDRNIGECACCPGWVYIVLAVFCFFFAIGLGIAFYGCFMRGKWWCDGYPPPIQPLLPKRGPPTVAPASAPNLPANIFRGYRSQDFISGEELAINPKDGGAAAGGPSHVSRKKRLPRSSAQRTAPVAAASSPSAPHATAASLPGSVVPEPSSTRREQQQQPLRDSHSSSSATMRSARSPSSVHAVDLRDVEELDV